MITKKKNLTLRFLLLQAFENIATPSFELQPLHPFFLFKSLYVLLFTEEQSIEIQGTVVIKSNQYGVYNERQCCRYQCNMAWLSVHHYSKVRVLIAGLYISYIQSSFVNNICMNPKWGDFCDLTALNVWKGHQNSNIRLSCEKPELMFYHVC